jgi:hypothetical protein
MALCLNLSCGHVECLSRNAHVLWTGDGRGCPCWSHTTGCLDCRLARPMSSHTHGTASRLGCTPTAAQRVGRGESRGTGMSEPCRRPGAHACLAIRPRRVPPDGQGWERDKVYGSSAHDRAYGVFSFVIFTVGKVTILPLCRPVDLHVNQTSRP